MERAPAADQRPEPGPARPPRRADRRTAVRIGLATFAILALELALIRWTSGQIRSFAYFNNLVLIGAFLGMGLGVALGERRPALVHLALPALLALSLPLTFSAELSLVHLPFAGQSVFLWGAEKAAGGNASAARNLAIFLGLFGLVALLFAAAGTAVGALFARLPASRAYGADLWGSLLGVAAVTGATFAGASPPLWIAIGALPLAWLAATTPCGRLPAGARLAIAILCAAGSIALGGRSAVGAVYSPYNRIDIERRGSSVLLSVNRDFHQVMHELSDESLARLADPAERERLSGYRAAYDLPFRLGPIGTGRARALVVGAGTGNDVQAALRNGWGEVLSVDIDGRILELGAELHPERPYSDARVVPIENDARAFFRQYRGGPFDAVVYGLLDSHAMFSSMSTLRLDNYVYTEEGIRAAWGLVSERGHLALSFSVFAGDWILDRLYWTVAAATGIEPVVLFHGMHYGATFLVARDPALLEAAAAGPFRRVTPLGRREETRTTSDDWPFLYVRPGVFPTGYAIVLGCVLALAGAATPLCFGARRLLGNFDGPLFFLGAAFLLIETRGVTSLALLLGSTWLVNSAVFAGILAVVLIANAAVARLELRSPLPWFALLAMALLALYAVDLDALNRLPLIARAAAGGILHALPVAFAGIIVPILLRRSASPAASLGSNLLGSVVGGCVEYASMWLGLGALVLLALAFYALAFAGLLWRRGVRA